VRLLLMSDIRVPLRARAPPAPLPAAPPRADLVFHAGDRVDTATLDLLKSRCRRLVAVHGNDDGPAPRARLPEAAYAEVGGVRSGVVRETGPAEGREARCPARFPGMDVLVFGHGHIPWDITAPSGPRLPDPGSPAGRRRRPHSIFVTATAADGCLTEVEPHRLPPRRAGTRPDRSSSQERPGGCECV
jgi:uncharacterized protein